MRIELALRVQPQWQLRAAGLHQAVAVKAIVDDLLHRIMGEPDNETVVLIPSPVGQPNWPKRGVWDVDEPHPAPEVPFRPM